MDESADTGKTRIDFRNVPVYMCTFTFEFMYISTRFRAGYQYKNSEFLGLVSRLKTTTAVPKTRGLPHSFGDTENEIRAGMETLRSIAVAAVQSGVSFLRAPATNTLCRDCPSLQIRGSQGGPLKMDPAPRTSWTNILMYHPISLTM